MISFPNSLISFGTFTRTGGVSKGAYDSLNLGEGHGDTPTNVEKNLIIAQEKMGCKQMVRARQVHGTAIVEVDKPLLSPPECDALITTTPGLGLLIRHADCQAAVFFDPVRSVIAAVHAGWKGQVQEIYGKVISYLNEHHRCNPKDLLVSISPSLGPESAEFIHYKKEFPQSFWPYQIKPNYFDLWAIAKMQLMERGILENHIQIAGIDTYQHPEQYFSYRRDKVCGRNGTYAFLTNSKALGHQ